MYLHNSFLMVFFWISVSRPTVLCLIITYISYTFWFFLQSLESIIVVITFSTHCAIIVQLYIQLQIILRVIEYMCIRHIVLRPMYTGPNPLGPWTHLAVVGSSLSRQTTGLASSVILCHCVHIPRANITSLCLRCVTWPGGWQQA